MEDGSSEMINAKKYFQKRKIEMIDSIKKAKFLFFESKFLLALLFLFSGCTFQYEKASSLSREGSSGQGFSPSQIISYETGAKSIIQRNCLNCHSEDARKDGGVSLSTYEQIKGKKDRIMIRTFDIKDMPPGGAISSNEREALKQWFENGLPKKDISKKQKTNPSKGFTFQSIKENVFYSCIECHSPPSPIKGLDLTDLSTVKKHRLTILERTVFSSDCPLPPYPILTELEKSALLTWISKGMPN